MVGRTLKNQPPILTGGFQRKLQKEEIYRDQSKKKHPDRPCAESGQVEDCGKHAGSARKMIPPTAKKPSHRVNVQNPMTCVISSGVRPQAV